MSNTSKRASPFQSSIFVPRSLKDDNCVIGDIVGEYTCVWRTCKGSLFAGSKGVYFLGSFFLFERKLVLGWDQIRQVQKVDRGVEVVLVADDTVHCFSGMPAPDRVWTLLVSLHNDALLDRRGRRRTPRGTLKRRNSDPWNSMVADDLFNDDEDIAADTINNELLSKTFSGSSQLLSSLVHSSTATGGFMWNAQEIESVAGELKLPPISCR